MEPAGRAGVGPRTQYAKTADGASIALRRTGTSGDVAVLIPGLGRSGRDFDRLADAPAPAASGILL